MAIGISGLANVSGSLCPNSLTQFPALPSLILPATSPLTLFTSLEREPERVISHIIITVAANVSLALVNLISVLAGSASTLVLAAAETLRSAIVTSARTPARSVRRYVRMDCSFGGVS